MPSTNSTSISTAVCNLPGTPLVARRAAIERTRMKMKEMTRVKNDAVEVDGPKSAVPRIHGEMREVVLDVARHPARHVFFGHHSETHKIPNRHLSRINPTQ